MALNPTLLNMRNLTRAMSDAERKDYADRLEEVVQRGHRKDKKHD